MKYLNSNCSLSSNIGNSDTIIFEVKTKKSFFRMIHICKFGFSEQIPQWSERGESNPHHSLGKAVF